MTAKSVFKRIARAVAPRAAMAISASRGRRHSHRLVKEWGLWDLNRRLIDEVGDQVLSGPFTGMTLSQLPLAEHVGPYLLGTYEAELHATWNHLLQHEYRELIDVGANFGYYAVGLARRFPRTRVVAFDVDWWARKAVAEMCAANNTPNVSIQSWCDPAWLARHLEHNSLIISDCEGYEGALFCSQMVPAFATASFVIELHEAFVPGVTERCRRMFAGSHTAQTVETGTEIRRYPQVASFTEEDMRRVSAEVRGPQQWLVLTPRASTGAAR